MGKGISSITIALIIVTIALAVWYSGQKSRWFISRSADDIKICQIDSNKFSVKCKDLNYRINRFSSTNAKDSVMHVEIKYSRGEQNSIYINIDTSEIHYLEIYNKIIPLKAISNCH